MSEREGRDERGQGSVLAVVVVTVMAVVTGLVLMITSLVMAVHSARGVADLSALAAAQSMAEGASDPCAAAREIARANGAEVRRCVSGGDEIDFAVVVRAAIRPRGAPRWFPRLVEAESTAGQLEER